MQASAGTFAAELKRRNTVLLCATGCSGTVSDCRAPRLEFMLVHLVQAVAGIHAAQQTAD